MCQRWEEEDYGAALRVLVFAVQRPQNNDPHLEFLGFIVEHGRLPVADEVLGAIRARGTHRRMRVLDGAQAPRMRVDGREVLLFAGSNYLDLARHPEVVDASVRAARDFGCAAGGSRLITGNLARSLHLTESDPDEARRRIEEARKIFLEFEENRISSEKQQQRIGLGTWEDLLWAGQQLAAAQSASRPSPLLPAP